MGWDLNSKKVAHVNRVHTVGGCVSVRFAWSHRQQPGLAGLARELVLQQRHGGLETLHCRGRQTG